MWITETEPWEKISDLRAKNRAQGWRATADVIGSHILDSLKQNPFPENFAKNWSMSDPDRYELRCYRNAMAANNKIMKPPSSRLVPVLEFSRRLTQGILVILASFDDDPEVCVKAVERLRDHWCVFNWQDMPGFGSMAIKSLIFDSPGGWEASGMLAKVLAEITGRESPRLNNPNSLLSQHWTRVVGTDLWELVSPLISDPTEEPPVDQ